jgi:hypothetical protein
MNVTMKKPCVAILNKQKCHFFSFYKNGEQEGKMGAVGSCMSGMGEEVGKGQGRGG